ncbi:MAG: Zn-dependent oligopeptidase [Planctomycetes bacterium]|nr:Zn-dependent oligopeptidase [Planctomycetota bacterium]
MRSLRFAGILAICAALSSCASGPGAPAPAVDANAPGAAALARADEAIRTIVAIPDGERTFANTVGAVDDLLARLILDTEMEIFMAYVSPDEAARERGLACERARNAWMIGLGKREDLYRAIRAYADTSPSLEGEEKRLLDHALRDYRRAGMMLEPARREELKKIELALNELELAFQKNIRDYDEKVRLTKDELRGLPDDFFAGREPEADGAYLLRLDYPTYMAVLQNAEEEETRLAFQTAYFRRGGKENVELLERILKMRAQRAHILGYKNIADFVTEIRMAHSADTVLRFIDDLRPKVRVKAKQDYDEMLAEKRAHTGNPDATLGRWDAFFYEGRLLRTKYAVDPEMLREYFPMDRVMATLFDLATRIFAITFRDVTDACLRDGTLWHPEVKAYDVIDGDGRPMGRLYTDMYPRPNKYGHFAQFSLRPRKVRADGSVVNPAVAIVANFRRPTEDKPSLMDRDEVETLYHEFGHCMHSLLAGTRLAAFSGTEVARDFVETPSQLFENWFWEREMLRTFPRHYRTGEALPDEVIDRLLAVRRLASGLKAELQLYYGLLDMTYHTDPDGVVDTTAVANRLHDEVVLYRRVPETYFQAGFGHLIGYHAGYYGYMWSLVYAQDVFTRFRETGLLDRGVGMELRRKILAPGGSREEMDMLVDFLGRPPKTDAFLEHLGLKKQEE